MTEPTKSVWGGLISDETAQKSNKPTPVRVPTLYATASTETRDQRQLGGRKSPTEIIKPSEFTSTRSFWKCIPRIETYER